MDRSVSGAVAGVEMTCQPFAVQEQLSSQHERPLSAGTQHSGPLWTAMFTTTLTERWGFLVKDVPLTSNTATTPGTLRTLKTLNTKKALNIRQLAKINLIEYLI